MPTWTPESPFQCERPQFPGLFEVTTPLNSLTDRPGWVNYLLSMAVRGKLGFRGLLNTFAFLSNPL